MNTVIKTTGAFFCLFFHVLKRWMRFFSGKEDEFMKLIVFFAECHNQQ